VSAEHKFVSSMQYGEEVEGFYLVESSQVRKTSSNPPRDYVDLALADKTGSIKSKVWNATEEDKAKYVKGCVVKLSAVVDKYNDQLVLKLKSIDVASDEDEYSVKDLIYSPVEGYLEGAEYKVAEYVESIKDKDLKTVVKYVLDKVGQAFYLFPASKSYHHNYPGGLAYHKLRMLELAEFLASQRPFLDRDLLVAGVLVHDVAKVVEYELENGVVKDYTTTGKLLGHIALAYEWVNEAVAATGADSGSVKVLALKHLVLSHHGKGEWGSPVDPKTPEAVALHYIDFIDAKLQAVEDAVARSKDTDEWTEPVKSLDGLKVFKTSSRPSAESDA